jgi:hypothetical protein
MAGPLTTLQSFFTGLAASLGVDPVYFIFTVGLIVWLISVGATPGSFYQKLRAAAGKTRISWVVLLLAMVLTHFTIITVKSQPDVPPTKYYFLGTLSAIFAGVMLKGKYDQIFKPGDY